MFRKFIFIALILGTFSCSDGTVRKEKEVSLDLNRKDLTKLFKGQELYSLKGIKTKFEGKTAKVMSIPTYQDHILIVNLKKAYYNGSQDFILHSNLNYLEFYQSLTSFIEKNKIFWPRMELIKVKFEDQISKSFVLIDIPTKEVIEYNGNRFLQIFSYSPSKKEFLLDESAIPDLVNLPCYSYDYNSLALIKFYLEKLNLNLSSLEAIKIIPNPLDNKLQFTIDFSYCTNKKDRITFDQYQQAIDQIKPIKEELIIDFSKIISNKKDNKENSSLQYKVLRGSLKLEDDLVYNNVNLQIEPGTTIKLLNKSKIVVNKGIVSLNGTVDAPIVIEGLGENSIFINKADSVTFSHVTFKGLSNWSDSCKFLPSALTIYNSNVRFNSCNFLDNKQGDDMVNCFHSNFIFDNCYFENILSDAVDSDFSNGSIADTKFFNVGNDGVDGSGSEIKMDGCNFFQIGDKAVSAGENSTMIINNNQISESAIGFVAKDGSRLILGDSLELRNNQLDFAIFMKKQFYDQPTLDFNSEIATYHYLFQEGTNINTIDKNPVFIKDVESKLYGMEYGKASK